MTLIVGGLLGPYLITGGLGTSAGPSFPGPDVLTAAQAWWAGTPAMAALTADGRIWHKSRPEGDSMPYATFFLVSDVPELRTTGPAFRRASVQINLHADTDADAMALALAVRAAFKMAPLVIAGESVDHVLPDGNGISVGEELGPSGRDCWVAFEVFDICYTSSV